MNLNQILENKLTWVAAIVGVVLLTATFAGPIVIDKITDKVVQRLMKEYSPGPYFPGGIDPDKVDPNIWRRESANKAIQFESGKDWEDFWNSQRQ